MLQSTLSRIICVGAVIFALATTSLSRAAWTEVSIPGTVQRPQDMVYFNGLFVAVGYGAEVITSPDGINWTLQDVPVEAPNPDYPNQLPSFRAVAASDSLIITVGDGGIIATSTNGTDWTVVQQGISGASSFQDIAYGDGTFVATRSEDAVATYKEGDIWRSSFVNADFRAREVVFLGDQFLLTPATGNTAYVGDTTGWSMLTSNLEPIFYPKTNFVKEIVFAGGNSEEGQKIAYATSSAGFSISTLSDGNIPGYTNGFASDGTLVAAVGGNFSNPRFGSVLVSSDNGVSFSLNTDQLSHVANAIAYANGLWVIVGETYAAYTDDLTPAPPSGPYLTQGAISYGNGWYGTWMGDINVGSWPWVFSGIGWFYAGTLGNTNASGWYFMTAAQLNCWLWTGDGSFPWVYCQPAGQPEGWWFAETNEPDFTYFFGPGGAVVAVPDAY